MIQVLQEIFEKTLARLSQHLVTYIPPLIVAAVILMVAFLLATVLRWVIVKVIKGASLDKFFRDTGLASVMDRSGHFRAASMIAGVAFWVILGIGFLTALDVFDTTLTSRMIESTVFAIPKLVTAGVILLAGFWLSRYLGRSMLVWAVNEGVPSARRLATVVKVIILFVAVVVAAETLGFAERVFFAAFVIFIGAAALAAGIAGGLTLKSLLDRSLNERTHEPVEEPEKSLWSHL
jgi:hypothetical protein